MNIKNPIDIVMLVQTLTCINFGRMCVNYFQMIFCLGVCCFVFYSVSS